MLLEAYELVYIIRNRSLYKWMYVSIFRGGPKKHLYERYSGVKNEKILPKIIQLLGWQSDRTKLK